jgi:Domain of unknown function (DUF222)
MQGQANFASVTPPTSPLADASSATVISLPGSVPSPTGTSALRGGFPPAGASADCAPAGSATSAVPVAAAASASAAGSAALAGSVAAVRAAGPAEPGEDVGCPSGLRMSWVADLTIDQVLAAARRHERHRAGQDLPAWGDVGCAGESEGRPVAGQEGDDLGEEALMATHEGRGRVLSVAELGGHAIVAPGPDLACWLACGEAAGRDDAALVTSITAWRKVTSWAQAQELAAVSELARRRRVAGAVDAGAADIDPAANAGCGDGDAVAELEAGFAPNEVALALTLTQGSAEDWMDLAVSLTRRLPATLAALGEGKIDLNRARLIDQLTSSLDVDLARAVERRVLARAENQTSGQLRASLQRAVLAADPAAAERRREEAEKRAWVALFGDHDGTASLSGRFLPAAQAAAAWARISAMAKAMEAAGAGGGMDLLRAQVFVGLLLGTLPLIPPADGALDNDGADAEVRDGEDPEDDRPHDEHPDDDGWSGGSRDPDGPPPTGNGPWGDAGAPRDEDAPCRTDPDDGSGGPRAGDPGTGGCAGVDPGPWPPLPLPGAIPAPGCARPGPARASPAGSQDRRGPPDTSPAFSVSATAGSSRLAGRAVLCVPWRTLAGWTREPGELGRIGPVTAAVARDLARAAVADVTREWKVIVVGRSGGAVAVAKVRRMRVGARGHTGGRRPPRWARAAGPAQCRALSGGSPSPCRSVCLTPRPRQRCRNWRAPASLGRFS